MRKELFYLMLAMVLLQSCNNDPKPKKYVFQTVQNSSNSLFVYDNNSNAQQEFQLLGSFPSILDTLPDYIESTLEDFLVIEEFEILSDDMLRIRFNDNGVTNDTTFNYVSTGNEIAVDNPDFDKLIQYDKDNDLFKICLYMAYGVQGPNTSGSQPQAYGGFISFCQRRSISDLLQEQNQMYDYATSDSFAIFLAEMIYQ